MVVTAMRNVLITGTPRSGTTLLCSLLNKVPDVVALHEPMNVWEFPTCKDANAVADVIDRFCNETRTSLHEHGYALSKHVGGNIPDNVAADKVNQRGTRLRNTEHGKVFVEKTLSPNFDLAIKHPVAFTALLETLSKRFECFAIIRNPLATLASWNSLAWLNVRNGHAPIGEKLDADLQRDLAAQPDAIERQLHILEWFYKRFRTFLPDAKIVKYEDLIASRGRELAKFFPAAAELDEGLSSKNVNKFYDRPVMLDLGARLLRRSGVIWDYYSKSDVEKLMAEASSATPAPSNP
jgi:hypothetical protein